MSKKEYCVYILTNSRDVVLYTGVTNNLHRRVSEHKNKIGSVFAKKYNVVNWFIMNVVMISMSRLLAKNKSRQVHGKTKLIWYTESTLDGQIYLRNSSHKCHSERSPSGQRGNLKKTSNERLHATTRLLRHFVPRNDI